MNIMKCTLLLSNNVIIKMKTLSNKSFLVINNIIIYHICGNIIGNFGNLFSNFCKEWKFWHLYALVFFHEMYNKLYLFEYCYIYIGCNLQLYLSSLLIMQPITLHSRSYCVVEGVKCQNGQRITVGRVSCCLSATSAMVYEY